MAAGQQHPGFASSTQGVRAPKVVIGLGVLALALVLACFHAFDPARNAFFPRCAFHSLTGLDCPGCGGQRALHFLLHGNFASAFRANALLLFLVPVGCWLGLRMVLWRSGWPALPAFFLNRLCFWLLLAALFGFGILRNLPGFEWLRP